MISDLHVSCKEGENGKLGKNVLAHAAETFGRKKGGVRHLWRMHKSTIVSPGKFKLDVKQKKGAD